MKKTTKEMIEEFNTDGKLLKRTTTEWIEETEDIKPNNLPWDIAKPYTSPIETGGTYVKVDANPPYKAVGDKDYLTASSSITANVKGNEPKYCADKSDDFKF